MRLAAACVGAAGPPRPTGLMKAGTGMFDRMREDKVPVHLRFAPVPLLMAGAWGGDRSGRAAYRWEGADRPGWLSGYFQTLFRRWIFRESKRTAPPSATIRTGLVPGVWRM